MPVGELAADAVPMLSASAEPLVLLEDREHTHHHHNPLANFPLRRKSSLPDSSGASGVASAISSSMGDLVHVRRRGASVPPSALSTSTSSSSSSSSSSTSAPPAAPPARRRGLTLSRHLSRQLTRTRTEEGPAKRRVTFKTTLHPEFVPSRELLSYDELLFNVAGLYQTTSYLHDAEDFGEDPSAADGDQSSAAPWDEPPLERSVPLMIAEFLYRSAVYVGYPTGDRPWIPGFRETKRFSVNDVRRWRRLAHYDWAREEREFEAQAAAKREGRKYKPGLERKDSSSSLSSFTGLRIDEPAVESTQVPLPSEAESGKPRGRARLRAAVSKMVHRRHRHRDRGRDKSTDSVEEALGDGKVDMERPPPVDPHKDLALLVSIVNSCVYCGAFQFRRRDIVALCNVDIDRF